MKKTYQEKQKERIEGHYQKSKIDIDNSRRRIESIDIEINSIDLNIENYIDSELKYTNSIKSKILNIESNKELIDNFRHIADLRLTKYIIIKLSTLEERNREVELLRVIEKNYRLLSSQLNELQLFGRIYTK